MAKLKVPSALHLSRLWRSDELAVKKALLDLMHSAPPFSYRQLLTMTRSMLAVKSDLHEMEQLIEGGVKSALARKCYLEIAPLLADYFELLDPSFVHEITPKVYALNRDLRVPFDPPMIYGARGRVHLPIFVFWRKNPLSEDQQVLLATMVHELISQDPDLDLASTSILDFSVQKGGGQRTLIQMPLADIPTISKARRDEMLAVFVAGYELAKKELAERAEAAGAGRSLPPAEVESDQRDLFGDI